MSEQSWRTLLQTLSTNLAMVGTGEYPAAVDRAIELLQQAFRRDSKVLVFGNGGSSADAQHISAELVGRFLLDRNPFPAIALTANEAFLTAWSNDRNFDEVFSRQIEALGRQGDVAWGISTSGSSRNVVKGLQRARELGLKTIGLTGSGGGDMAPLCDVLMAVPLTETPRIQEIHLITYHAICAALEQGIT